MERIECRTQSELEAALTQKDVEIHLVGGGFFTAWGNSQVTAWGNSQVTARGNSQVTARENSQVTARGNSQVTACGNSQVTARENSQVTARENSQVTARGNSQVTACGNSQVTARENSQVTARENSQVTASKHCPVLLRDKTAKAKGGIQKKAYAYRPKLAKEWCEFYGVNVSNGVALLFKGVRTTFCTAGYGFEYKPGSTPQAPDWDGGKAECGGGLHFSPCPEMTLEFDDKATNFIACPVRLKDIAIHPNGQYPQKCKAPGLCAPCYEVNRKGERI